MKNKNNESGGCVTFAVTMAFVLFLLIVSSNMEPYRKAREPEPSNEAEEEHVEQEEVTQEEESTDEITSDVQREFIVSYNSICSTPRLTDFEVLYVDSHIYTRIKEDVSVLDYVDSFIPYYTEEEVSDFISSLSYSELDEAVLPPGRFFIVGTRCAVGDGATMQVSSNEYRPEGFRSSKYSVSIYKPRVSIKGDAETVAQAFVDSARVLCPDILGEFSDGFRDRLASDSLSPDDIALLNEHDLNYEFKHGQDGRLIACFVGKDDEPERPELGPISPPFQPDLDFESDSGA